MALPDPELELLQELLADDPGADVFVTVGEELMRRDRHAEAVLVLAAGVEENPDEEAGWRLLVLAAQRDGQNLRALAALTHCAVDRADDLELARAEVMALEGSGQLQRARAAAEVLLAHHANDIVGEAVVERLSTPIDARGSSPDPLVTVQRAEEYVAVGRIDRAIRVYRRLLHHAPDDPTLAHRLRELVETPFAAEDDLSEDLTADENGGPPPSFPMPAPLLGVTALAEEPPRSGREEDRTDPNIDVARARERRDEAMRDAATVPSAPARAAAPERSNRPVPDPGSTGTSAPPRAQTPVPPSYHDVKTDPDTDEAGGDDDSEEMMAQLLDDDDDELIAVHTEEDEDTMIISEDELEAVDDEPRAAAADPHGHGPSTRRRSLFRR